MNQLLFEGRSLVGIVSSIIRQDDRKVAYARLDWENMYRLSDYHKVANIVYLGLLGYREMIPDRWMDRFFKRYQESLLFGENCDDSLKEILTWLDMREVSCTILTSESVRGFYKIAETADNSPIQIFLDEEKYYLAKGYLIDLGYETDETYKGFGERLKKVSHISIILYRKLPFRTSRYGKNMVKLLETAHIKEPYAHIWEFPRESEFIYRLAGASYRYVTDELTLREVLELLLCHRAWKDEIDEERLWKKLSEFKIDGIAEKILDVAYMWFGDKDDNYLVHQTEDMAVYDVLEDRLLTRGIVNRENDDQALKLQYHIQKEIEKEKKAEGIDIRKEKIQKRLKDMERKMKWVFPDHHYMSSIYPAVEKVPVLLPVFWIVRGLRILWRTMIR